MNINNTLQEILFQNEEKEKRAAELLVANKELAFQNEEKEKRAAELFVANKELFFQNQEKEKRANELIIANAELVLQKLEKEQRAAELIIANEELIFQNEEKEKRAAELLVANKELAFQSEEKEKRAGELVVANKELIFQNEEKEKRAAELFVANKELAFQNEEKEKRAGELIIANAELVLQNLEKKQRASDLIVTNKELRKVEEELEKSNSLFYTLFEYNPAALAISRISNSQITHVNSCFLSLFGYDTIEEIIGKTSAELNMLADPKQRDEIMRQLKANNKAINLEGQIQTRQGELKWVSTFAHAIEINGEPYLLAAILDITGRKKIEEQLLHANKELESFSYSVSHDLRAPLRAIHGYSKMLKANFEAELGSEANRLINNIVSNAKKMGQLIDDLLSFSRIGRKELVKINIPMHSLVSEICSGLINEQGDRIIEFHINELLPAMADNMGIRQVWVNLISNAIKYSRLKDKAIIEIGAEIKDEEIIYYIKDNGAGFDMRYAGKLFGVFQRLHSDEEFEGTGVGLALVQRIIDKHGGRVWGEGRVNKGAIFYFTLHK